MQAAYIAEQPGVTIIEFATPDEATAAVKNGEADATFADIDYLAPLAKDSNGELFIVKDKAVEMGNGIGIGLRQSDVELKAKFDAAIQSMKADGTLNPMIVKYFGAESEQF